MLFTIECNTFNCSAKTYSDLNTLDVIFTRVHDKLVFFFDGRKISASFGNIILYLVIKNDVFYLSRFFEDNMFTLTVGAINVTLEYDGRMITFLNGSLSLSEDGLPLTINIVQEEEEKIVNTCGNFFFYLVDKANSDIGIPLNSISDRSMYNIKGLTYLRLEHESDIIFVIPSSRISVYETEHKIVPGLILNQRILSSETFESGHMICIYPLCCNAANFGMNVCSDHCTAICKQIVNEKELKESILHSKFTEKSKLNEKLNDLIANMYETSSDKVISSDNFKIVEPREENTLLDILNKCKRGQMCEISKTFELDDMIFKVFSIFDILRDYHIILPSVEEYILNLREVPQLPQIISGHRNKMMMYDDEEKEKVHELLHSIDHSEEDNTKIKCEICSKKIKSDFVTYKNSKLLLGYALHMIDEHSICSGVYISDYLNFGAKFSQNYNDILRIDGVMQDLVPIRDEKGDKIVSKLEKKKSKGTKGVEKCKFVEESGLECGCRLIVSYLKNDDGDKLYTTMCIHYIEEHNLYPEGLENFIRSL